MTAATLTGPPSSNTGANTCPLDLSYGVKIAADLHFDWYEATIRSDVSALVVVSSLGARLGVSFEAIRPQNGYGHGYRLVGLDAGTVAVYGGGTDAMGTHVKATSAAAVLAAEVIRERWPDHRVSRVDVALDFDQPGAWDALEPLVEGIARNGGWRGRAMKVSTVGDWPHREDPLAPLTLYCGASSGRLSSRLYRKGVEQLEKDPNCGASLHWVRFEWQVRPDSGQKAWAARASLLELVGMTPYGAAVARALVAADVAVLDRPARFASQDPGYWMAKQYGTVVDELLALDPLDMAVRLAAWRSLALGERLPEGAPF